MPHKLLIEFDINFDHPLKRFLKPGEVIRGEPVELAFSVTNLGTETFPGGMVKDWRILYGPDRNVMHYSSTANIECNIMPPGDKTKLMSERVVPVTEGLSWIVFSIEPEGSEKAVEYHQNPEDTIGEGEWMHCFYVVNRESLLLASLIEGLTEQR